MKKFFILIVMLAVASASFADRPAWPTQNTVPVNCNFGFKDIATPTITINNAIVNLDDYLPAGTIGFEIRCASGSFVIGNPNDIATGTNRVGRLVSAGESYTWNGTAGNFVGAILGTASSTIVVIDAAWGDFEE